MIGEVSCLNASIVNLFHLGIASPQNTIAECGHSLFFASVVLGGPNIVFVGWFEVDCAFLELIEKQFHMRFISCLFLYHCLTRILPCALLQFNVHLTFILSVIESR